MLVFYFRRLDMYKILTNDNKEVARGFATIDDAYLYMAMNKISEDDVSVIHYGGR